MQKKVAMILVGGLLACLMGGCGQSEVGTDTMATVDETIAENTEVTEEDGQAEESTEEADTVEAEETVSDSSTDESVEENGEEETVEGDEFPVIDEYVLEQDNSDEYGVYSTSCYDLDQYLNEDGTIPGYDDYDSEIYYEYSGRWAYPKFTPCRFFEDLTVIERVDCKEFLMSHDAERDQNLSTFVYSGLNMYTGMKTTAESGTEDYDIMFTAQTVDGETEVIHGVSRGSFTVGGGEPVEVVQHSYTFSIGNFSVMVLIGTDPLSEEEVRLIIDNIRLTNGLER